MIPILRSTRVPAGIAALIALVACSGRGPSTPIPAPGAAPAPPTSPSRAEPTTPAWLEVDSAGRTATLTLEVTAPAGALSALINGYRAGEVQIVVPLGWTVKWDWHSTDSLAAHSLVVMVEREKIPLEGGRPAFSNAMTRMVTAGLRTDQTDQTTFVAEEPGWFWILCGVPNHALNGEWIGLRVDPEAKTARVQVKREG
jgi:hypothetical protein